MSALAVRFEVFDPEDVVEFGMLSKTAAMKQACDAAYQQGYRDAEAAEAAARLNDKRALLARIAEAADDFSITNAEARAAILVSLRPLIVRIVGSVLPACADAGLAQELAELVTQLAINAPAASLCIHVSAEQRDAIHAAMQSASATVQVCADPQLTGLQARVGGRDGWEQIDLGKAAESALRVVEDFFDAAKEERRNAG